MSKHDIIQYYGTYMVILLNYMMPIKIENDYFDFFMTRYRGLIYIDL